MLIKLTPFQSFIPPAQNLTDYVLHILKLFFLVGILDQGSGVLIIFDDTPVDKTYENSLEIIQNMGKVVDALYNKAKKLS